MNDKISIVIADDHTLFREGLAGIISAADDFEVVGQAGSRQEAVQLARDLLPDIILLDIDMPGGGLEAARMVAEECPVTRIVILTSSEEDDHLIRALKIGARAYILKGVAARELIRILRAVWAGDSYVPPMLAASLLLEMREANSQQKQSTSPLDELTSREREILESLAAGLSNKEIGEKLFISDKTVKHYMTNILQKLQVRNRVEAALLAQKEMKKS
jgi:DNA-binding NarL/FixJ family response regulator